VEARAGSTGSLNAAARRARYLLAWDALAPDEAIQIKVKNGWVTLTGWVEWQYQQTTARSDIRKLSGVAGVSDEIDLQQVSAPDVRNKIMNTLKRNAEVEANTIQVSVNGDE
jgi:osmotically-inducible protein OsmY